MSNSEGMNSSLFVQQLDSRCEIEQQVTSLDHRKGLDQNLDRTPRHLANLTQHSLDAQLVRHNKRHVRSVARRNAGNRRRKTKAGEVFPDLLHHDVRIEIWPKHYTA